MQSFVQVQGLKQSFPNVSGEGDLVVFDDINFEITKGDFVCIIGHSGCGKTTILNVLAGLDECLGSREQPKGNSLKQLKP